ncbi:MAG TPA: hypothetical protein VGR73_03750 [Bryobacteraceae bacterium]|nr:hypothetical protein [Bryobacteraceae bacterium]
MTMSPPILTSERCRVAGARLTRFWDGPGRRVAGAMTTTGSGALASGLLSALAAKLLAASGGPAALATLATLQQVRQAAIVAATVNGQTALVQGASARVGDQRREYIRTAVVLMLAATLSVAAALLRFPGVLLRVVGMPPEAAPAFRWLVAATTFSTLFVFCTALLNALGRIRALATLQAAAPLALAVGIWPAAHTGPALRPQAFAMLLSITAAIPAAAGVWLLARSWTRWRHWLRGGGRWWSPRAARAFLAVSSAMLISGLIASATLIAVRGRIVVHQGLDAAGWFDAAWNISMNQASLLVASLQTYCLPALARARSAREQSAHINGVLTLAMPAAAVTIAFVALAKPWIVELLYAPSFRPAAALLRWTLVGDYFKIGSWILSLPLLARADMRAFLLLEVAAYATFAGLSLGLSRWGTSAESAAAAFASMYAVHLAAGFVLSRSRCGIRLNRSAVAVWGAGLAVVTVASGLSWNRL